MTADPLHRGDRTPDEDLLAGPAPVTDGTRVARMASELAHGFATLSSIGPAVTVFGSARTPREHPEYDLARDLGGRLGAAGYAVITGGGGGIMEAANRGAREAGVPSVGLTVDLPFEEMGNPWIDVPLHFHYFFTRKVMFVRYATAFVVMPGGYGTLDELFECLMLMQTAKIRSVPLVLVGSGYWGPLVAWLRERVAADGKISPGDLDLFRIEDDLDAVVALVRAASGPHAPRQTGDSRLSR